MYNISTGVCHIRHNNGKQAWLKDGKAHRDGDLPAIIDANGDQMWYQHGQLHRGGDLPAIIRANGNQVWFHRGKLHRGGDLPALIRANGNQEWYQHGKQHRGGDLPAIINANGDQAWCQNGNTHRGNNLPAIIHANGTKMWCQHGQLHCVGRPAIIRSNGTKLFYLNGEQLTPRQTQRASQSRVNQFCKLIATLHNARVPIPAPISILSPNPAPTHPFFPNWMVNLVHPHTPPSRRNRYLPGDMVLTILQFQQYIHV